MEVSKDFIVVRKSSLKTRYERSEVLFLLSRTWAFVLKETNLKSF